MYYVILAQTHLASLVATGLGANLGPSFFRLVSNQNFYRVTAISLVCSLVWLRFKV
jgi:hypothetical protein